MEFRSHSGPETTGLCWQVRRRLKRRSQVRARKWLCSKSVAEQELSARQFPLMSCKSPREIQSYSKSAAQKTRIRRKADEVGNPPGLNGQPGGVSWSSLFSAMRFSLDWRC